MVVDEHPWRVTHSQCCPTRRACGRLEKKIALENTAVPTVTARRRSWRMISPNLCRQPI